jgi:hypothetical protein
MQSARRLRPFRPIQLAEIFFLEAASGKKPKPVNYKKNAKSARWAIRLGNELAKIKNRASFAPKFPKTSAVGENLGRNLNIRSEPKQIRPWRIAVPPR